MKILFSPSEAKSQISLYPPKISFVIDDAFGGRTFTHKQESYTLKDKRSHILNLIQNAIDSSDDATLQDAFGTSDISQYKTNLLSSPTQKAVLRYTGVGYQALDYQSLDQKAQDFIDQNMIIFSNIFGAIYAGEHIPLYKLKQGKTLSNINIPKYYKTYFSSALDELLDGDDIVDLRADFYTKFYTPRKHHYGFKFTKNGKVINHYSKHYKGIIARIIATLSAAKTPTSEIRQTTTTNEIHTSTPTSEIRRTSASIDELLDYIEQNFAIIQTQTTKNKTLTTIQIND